MGTYYTIFGLIVLFSLIGLIGNIVSNSSKEELLDTMFENSDIDVATYKKYKILIKK